MGFQPADDLLISDQVHKIQSGRVSTGSVRSKLRHPSMMFTEEGRQQFYLPPVKNSMNSVFPAIYNGDFAAEIMSQREDLAA